MFIPFTDNLLHTVQNSFSKNPRLYLDQMQLEILFFPWYLHYTYIFICFCLYAVLGGYILICLYFIFDYVKHLPGSKVNKV